jgi:hypothetical protein
LSTHAKRLAALSAQIASLEQENVGTKPWALAGEAGSRSRPINAILEEDLEFESVGKQVPVVTEEKVKGLEELIKKRILDVSRPLSLDCFLPVRKEEEKLIPNFPPSRYLCLPERLQRRRSPTTPRRETLPSLSSLRALRPAVDKVSCPDLRGPVYRFDSQGYRQGWRAA